MTDDGADKQPVSEAENSAPATPAASPPADDAAALAAIEGTLRPPVRTVSPTLPAEPPAAPAAVPVSADPAPTLLAPLVEPSDAVSAPADPIPASPELQEAPAAPAEAAPVVADAPAAPVAPETNPLELVAPDPVAPEPAEAPQPEPASAPPTEPVTAPVVPPLRPVAGGVPPMLEFVAWRLLELVATMAVATLLLILLLGPIGATDTGLLTDRIAVTLPLVVLSLLVAAMIGVPLGAAAALGLPAIGAVLRFTAVLGGSLSPIWLAMLLVLVFAVTLQWLQPGGFVPWVQSPVGALASLVLPALGLGLPLAGQVALGMRDALRAALRDKSLATAEDLGLGRTEAIWTQAMRRAMAGLAERMTVPLALLVPAALVIETVFYLPGLGRLIFTAFADRDLATLHVGLLALVGLIALCRLLGRMLHALADPRIARRA